jgi:hypothetical protein
MPDGDQVGEIQRCRIVQRRGHLHLPWCYRREWYSARLIGPSQSGATIDRTRRRHVYSWATAWGRGKRERELARLTERLQEKGWTVDGISADGLPLLWRIKPPEPEDVDAVPE